MAAIRTFIEKNPLLLVALITPSVLLFIFSFFNLSAAPDPTRAMASLTLGVVDLDKGQGPIKVGDRLIPGLEANLPFGVTRFADEASARAALEDGKVSALMILPENFTAQAMGKEPKSIKVVTSQHLSLTESQFGASLPQQLSSGIATAIAMAQAQMGGAPPVVVTAESEVVHAASSNTALAAPVAMSFAVWLAGWIGAFTLYLGSRKTGKPTEAAALRTLLPVASAGLASLVAAIVVAWLAGVWGVFPALWLVAWVALYAILLLLGGLFAVFGAWAILIVLPVVFYQSAVAGVQTPLAAAPEWLRWLGEWVPFADLTRAFRSIIIGGPFGGLWTSAIAAGVIGLALIWLGAYASKLWAQRNGREIHA